MFWLITEVFHQNTNMLLNSSIFKRKNFSLNLLPTQIAYHFFLFLLYNKPFSKSRLFSVLFLSSHSLLNPIKSGFSPHHSTKTILVKSIHTLYTVKSNSHFLILHFFDLLPTSYLIKEKHGN